MSLSLADFWPGPAAKSHSQKKLLIWSSTPPKYKFPALNQGQRMAHRCYKRMGAPGFPRKVHLKTSSLGFSQASAFGGSCAWSVRAVRRRDGCGYDRIVTATVLDCMLCYMYIYACYLLICIHAKHPKVKRI